MKIACITGSKYYVQLSPEKTFISIRRTSDGRYVGYANTFDKWNRYTIDLYNKRRAYKSRDNLWRALVRLLNTAGNI